MYLELIVNKFKLKSCYLKIYLIYHLEPLHQWIDFLNSNNRTCIFLHFYKVIVLFTTIPVTTCSCERAFSKLTIVKTKLRSTMTQERLDAFMFLFIEQQMTTNINYDEVIEEFKMMIPTKRRLEL